jgi:4-methyl-5(b-hydroxyethyl)-thiazole monophosphate biosynthesis
MTKKVLVPIADGTEEIEAVTIIDVLRRAGAQVTVASVNQLQVTASRGVKLVADCLIAPCADLSFDLVALPGGMPGSENLHENQVLKQLLARQQESGRLYGAICAAPAVVLETQGLLKGRQATSHPNFIDRLQSAKTSSSAVVVDGNCVTSQGPGTALAFALALVEQLYGKAKRKEVEAPMVII